MSDSDMREQDYPAVWEEYLRDRAMDSVLALADSYPDERSLLIAFKDLERFNQTLADHLLANPEKVLGAANSALHTLDTPLDVDLSGAFVRVVNLPAVVRLKARQIREYHTGKLIASRA